jgi:putative ABC transport system permease protein
VARLSAAFTLLRRLRSETAIVVLLFVMLAATSFLFAAAPRVLNRVTDDAVRFALASALASERDVQLTASGTIKPGRDPGVAAIKAYGEQREASFPAPIEDLIAGRFFGATTPRFGVVDSIVDFNLRYQERVPETSTLVSGRWPADRGMPLRQVRLGEQQDPGAPPAVFEMALSTTEAEVLDAHVGDRFPVRLDTSDSLVPRTVFGVAPTEMEVVGLFEPQDAGAGQWVGSGLLEPAFKYGPSGIEAIYATAYVSPEIYPSLSEGLLPFRFDWHYEVDPARMNADQIDSVQIALQQLNLDTAPTDNQFLDETRSVVGLTGVTMTSGMPRIFGEFEAQRSRTESVLSIAAVGLLGLAGGATAMLAILLMRRRRGGLLLARGRGASGSLLLGAELLEALLIAGGAALLGLIVAIVFVPAREAPTSFVLAAIVGVTGAVLLLAATWPSASKPLIQLERADAPVMRVPVRRLVIDATIVGIAILAIVLLRDRGLTIGPATETPTFDPLLAAVPLLAGLAAGIIAMRLYPLPVRALSRLATRRADFVAAVGLRTVSRRPATLPLLVLLLTAAFGAFASVVATSIDRGQVAASYLEIGADYRLEAIGSGSLPATMDPSTVPGVEAVAEGVIDRRASLVTGPNQHVTIDLDAVDANGYARVAARTAADQRWPGSFFAQPPAVGIGNDANPVPAILSDQVPAGISDIRVGDTFTATTNDRPLHFRVVGRQQSFPGHGNGATFAIVPLDWMKVAFPTQALTPSVMWLRAPSSAAAAIAELADTPAAPVRVVSRPEAYSRLHDAPLGSAVADFFFAALIVAIVYMAVTLVGAVVLSAADRTRDLAYMRTLGVSRRQAQALTAVEHAPVALLALIPGVLLGVAVAVIVQPGLGLAGFVGAEGLPMYIDWPTLIIVILVLAAVVAGAVAAGTWLASRARLASALRIGES